MRYTYLRRNLLARGVGPVDAGVIFEKERSLHGAVPVQLALKFAWPPQLGPGFDEAVAAAWRARFISSGPRPWDAYTPYVLVAGGEVWVRWLAGLSSVDGAGAPPWAGYVIQLLAGEVQIAGGGASLIVRPLDHVASWQFNRYSPFPMFLLYTGLITRPVTRVLISSAIEKVTARKRFGSR